MLNSFDSLLNGFFYYFLFLKQTSFTLGRPPGSYFMNLESTYFVSKKFRSINDPNHPEIFLTTKTFPLTNYTTLFTCEKPGSLQTNMKPFFSAKKKWRDRQLCWWLCFEQNTQCEHFSIHSKVSWTFLKESLIIEFQNFEGWIRVFLWTNMYPPFIQDMRACFNLLLS